MWLVMKITDTFSRLYFSTHAFTKKKKNVVGLVLKNTLEERKYFPRYDTQKY